MSAMDSPSKRKVEKPAGHEVDPEVTNKLPKITDLLDKEAPIPAAFATTISEITTVQTGEVFNTIPENSQIVIPVLPECVPLIAEVPDVVTETRPGTTKPATTNEEVKISQVLPGYAPSYASDYVPSEVNTNSYNSFVNTISFNVSRYPTLTEITDSKNYSKKEDAKKKDDKDASKQDKQYEKKTFDYVPAEYLTGQDTKVNRGKVYQTSCTMVAPEVLNSGRVLTTMSVPSYSVNENGDKKDETTDTEEDKSGEHSDNKSVKDSTDNCTEVSSRQTTDRQTDDTVTDKDSSKENMPQPAVTQDNSS